MKSNNVKTKNRALVSVYRGQATSDGDGVKLTRIIGTHQLDMLDPFLLLDCFESDNASDYIGGFPTHPHRGFETVTYLLNGKMRHKDSAGNEGVVEAGGVQWMTAGKGVLHSEMPEQEEGLLKGFQLWVNLPKASKMVAPAYQEFPASSTPLEARDNGTLIRVIAGKTAQGTTGPVINAYIDPTYMDISLPAGTQFEQWLPEGHNAFIYIIEGGADVVGEGETVESITQKHLGILGGGTQLLIKAKQPARFLLIAGQPLNEPVARGGPFVMNTQQELLQAFDDYSKGRLIT